MLTQIYGHNNSDKQGDDGVRERKSGSKNIDADSWVTSLCAYLSLVTTLLLVMAGLSQAGEAPHLEEVIIKANRTDQQVSLWPGRF